MGIQDIPNPALSPGELIIVSGANGFIASHVADQALAAGFRVRGTTRSAEKHAWLQEHFDAAYGLRKFELIEVKDMVAEGAFDEAVKGAAGFIHVASNMSFAPDIAKVTHESVQGTITALASAAAASPPVRRFVLTSSSVAASMPRPGEVFDVTAETWNDVALERIKQPDPSGFEVYAASKTLAERRAWEWVEENKPGFVLNAVLPNANLGRPISFAHQGHPSTSGLVSLLFRGRPGAVLHTAPQHFVNVRDTALLHIVALLHPGVASERVFAFAAPFNHNDTLAALRRMYPGREFMADIEGLGKDMSTIVQKGRAEELLREGGRERFVGFYETVRENTVDLVKAGGD